MSKSKARIHSYMKHNKISDLFEELMGKLIHELPSNPVVFLIKYLQSKNSGETTEDYKGSVLLKHQLSKTQPFSNQGNITSNQLTKNRKYDKPWLKNTRHQRSKQDLSKTADDVLLQHKTSETQPQGIDNTEVVSIEEKSKETFTEEKQFSSSKIFGKKNYKRQYDENELKCKDDIENQSQASPSVKRLSAKKSKKHKQQLLKKKLLELENSSAIVDIGSESSSNEDDVIEICEDFDELKNEGVLNPPKGGIHIKRRAETRTEQIKLNLNISKFFDKLGGALDSDRPNSRNSNFNKSYDYLDDIESASQVTGPRRLVWEPAASDEVSERHLKTEEKVKSRKMRDSQMFDDQSSSKITRGKSEVSATFSLKNQKASSDVGDGKSTTLSKLTPARASAKMAMNRCKSKNTSFFPEIKEEKKRNHL